MDDSLGEALPKEQARIRKLIKMYRDPELCGAGEFAATMMELALQKADQAIISGDIIAMIQAYKDLQEYKE